LADRDGTLREIEGPPGTDPTARGGWPDRRWTLVVGAALVAAALVLPLLRDGGRPADVLWAEDGQIYWQQAHDQGGGAVLLRGYAGYVQLPPRLVGVVIGLVPIGRLAEASAVAATLVATALAGFTYWATAATIASRLVRVALASLLVVGPVLGPENNATYTNTIWLFAAVVPVALLATYGSTIGALVCAAVLFLAATSTPLVVVFVPLAIGRLLVDRHRRAAWVVVGAFALGIAVQAGGLLASGDSSEQESRVAPTMSQYAHLTASRVFSVLLFGLVGLEELLIHHAPLLEIGSTVVVVGGFGLLLIGAGRRAQLLAGALFLSAVAAFAVALRSRGVLSLEIVSDHPFGISSTRFSVVPVFVLTYAAAMLIAPTDLGHARRLGPALRAGFVMLIVVTTVASFPYASSRSRLPSWSHLVDVAAAACVSRPAPTQTIVYMPFPAFRVVVPCGELRPDVRP
jgi:hypothetical protein